MSVKGTVACLSSNQWWGLDGGVGWGGDGLIRLAGFGLWRPVASACDNWTNDSVQLIC